jgi:hypothetical protein
MSSTNGQDGGGLAGRLKALLANRVAWLTDERRDASGAPTRAAALVTVLGREHYVERRRQYPIVSRRDLEGVLRQELEGRPPTLTMVAPVRDDRREVTFFEIEPDATSRAGPCLWLVPESVALATTMPEGAIATVERHGFRYFLAANGVSQPSGGSLTSADVFALAAGLEARETMALGGDEDLRARVIAGLGHLPGGAWLSLRAPSLRPRFDFDWQPIALIAGVGLVGYLALASAYLAVARDAREKELAGLGGEVEKLLTAQRDVDRMLAEQAGLAAIVADRRYTYRLWQPVAVAWSKGANIDAIQLQDAKLTLRGSAPVATDVLAALSAIPGFADAKFSSPVREGSSGRQEFNVTLTMLAEADRG